MKPSKRARSRRHRRARWQNLVACLTLVCSACSGSASNLPETVQDVTDPDAVRYRLRLRDNPVDSGQAFRCYGQCQDRREPRAYLECLMECPGFETTEGVRCARDEVPPVAACFTARQVPRHSEPGAGWVVLAVLANVAIIVSLASVCASSSSQCGYASYPYLPY